MSAFQITSNAIDLEAFRQQLLDPSCGAYVQFDGWVRDHNEGPAGATPGIRSL